MTIVLDDRKLFTDGHHHTESRVKITVRDVNLWYDHGEKHALKEVNLDVYENEVTAFIGPSGCGNGWRHVTVIPLADDRGALRQRKEAP